MIMSGATQHLKFFCHWSWLQFQLASSLFWCLFQRVGTWLWTLQCPFKGRVHFAEALEWLAQWMSELGLSPPGNSDPVQRNQWEQPGDAGSISERGKSAAATAKAKSFLQIMKDRGLTEEVRITLLCTTQWYMHTSCCNNLVFSLIMIVTSTVLYNVEFLWCRWFTILNSYKLESVMFYRCVLCSSPFLLSCLINDYWTKHKQDWHIRKVESVAGRWVHFGLWLNSMNLGGPEFSVPEVNS